MHHRHLAYLITALVCSACFAEESSDRHRAADVRAGGLRPTDDCLTCPDDTGGGGPDDPSPDAGPPPEPDASTPPSDAGTTDATKVPWDEPPIDTLADPKKLVDLLPVPNDDTYCPRDKEGALVVKIENHGTVTSPSTTTRVTFAEVGDVSVATNAVAAGGEQFIHVPIPSACFTEGGGNCTIIIKADAHLEASESDESNNEVKDVCLGSGF